jgi:hypothetical protein
VEQVSEEKKSGSSLFMFYLKAQWESICESVGRIREWGGALLSFFLTAVFLVMIRCGLADILFKK